MRNINKQALIAKIKKQAESFDTVVLREDEANALLDELEAAENNLIDSECHGAELEESLRDKQALLESSEKRIAELSRHLQCAHDFIEHTEAFGYEASNGILCCGDAQWNIDSSKAALASAGSVNGEG